MKTKQWYGDQVLNMVYPVRSRDEKIDIREVYVELDKMVNAQAKAEFVQKFKGRMDTSADEMFMTRLEWLVPTDPANGVPSFVTLTTNYVALPGGEGINEVYFQNLFSANKKKYFDPVIIERKKDRALYRSNMAARAEGRISCYPSGMTITFDRGNIGATYGSVGVALVVRDFSLIADDAIYPIGADSEKAIIDALVELFRTRLGQNQNLIKDSTKNK